MKSPISQVLLQTSLLIVQFSKTYLKTLSWTFLWTDAFVAFEQSLSSIPSTSFQVTDRMFLSSHVRISESIHTL